MILQPAMPRLTTSSTVPVTLAFRFPAGRYHATPYGHHVNEGLIEWPPSPWRILRALISVGYTSGVWDGHGPSSTARELVAKLAAELPSYRLPPVIGTHSRHYMPVGNLDSKTKLEKMTLVFDTWAHIEGEGDDSALLVSWKNCALTPDELHYLEILISRMNYLGRSESWVVGRVLDSDEHEWTPNCFPEQPASSADGAWEQVTLLAPTSVSHFERWRTERVDEALADLPLPEGSRPTKTLLKKRCKAEEPYPADLLDCLQKDTNWLRSHGWSLPPGSQRVFYWRLSSAISVGSPKLRHARASAPRVQAVLLSLTNDSRNDHALPPITRTLPQAECLHSALVGTAVKMGISGTVPPELTGRDECRQPLGGPHEHAHVNPLDLDGDGHLDHILVWAKMGLGVDAQAAIRAVRKMRKRFSKGAMEPLRLAVSALGELENLEQLHGSYGANIRKNIRKIVCDAPRWVSLTPFVPPRYIKVRGRNTLEGQVRAELESRGFPDPVVVDVFWPSRHVPGKWSTEAGGAGRAEANWHRFRHFKVSRRKNPQPPVPVGFAVGIEFADSVRGPIALGYGSHFGLGLLAHSAPGQAG